MSICICVHINVYVRIYICIYIHARMYVFVHIMPPLSRRVAGGRECRKGPSLIPQSSICLTFENLYPAALEQIWC